MNGAESLVRTLVGGGVDVCFANPGTSEMHIVAALDRVDGMRCVLGLFEGVVTGAADGYYRMADNPAATLLHLGPGLANGLANIHNANKAASGMVNIIGDHATYHRQYDAPLTSDIEGLARPSSHWVKTSPDAMSIARDGAAAIAAARTPPGQIASLILPADTAWNDGSGPVERIPYVVDHALKVLDGLRHVILVGAKMPVAFFAYPNKPSRLTPEGCEGHVLARPEEDHIQALEWLCDEVGARATPAPVVNDKPAPPATGAITSEALGQSLGALLPDNAIVADEAVTTGRGFFAATKSAMPHDWMSILVSSFGLRMPLATGAAVACPDRRVVS